MRPTFVIALFLLPALMATAASSQDSGQFRKALDALGSVFETIYAADATFATADDSTGANLNTSARMLSAPLIAVRRALEPLGAPIAQVAWSDSIRVLVGASDFEPPDGPSGLGDVRARLTYILELKPGSSKAVSRALSASIKRPKIDSVWSWTVPGTEGHPEPFTMYASLDPEPYFVIADNRQDLATVTQKLSQAAVGKVVPFDDVVLRDTAVIGLRRYRHEERNKAAAGTLDIARDATTLSLRVPRHAPIAVLSISAASSRSADHLNSRQLFPPFRQTSDGVWEVTLPLVNNNQIADQLIAILALFGFGIYV